MKKILPLSKPIIDTYPSIANPLSIIQLNPKSYDWICSNFLSLSATYNKENNNFGVYLSNGHQLWTDILIWKECPYINFYRTERWIYEKYNINIVDFIIEAINRERYVYLYVRKKDIEDYNTENDLVTHDIMIYGYDSEEKIFYANDYFDNHYGTRLIKQEQFKVAFESCLQINGYKDGFEGVISFSQPDTIEMKRNLAIYEKSSPKKRYLRLYIESLDEFLGERHNSEKMVEDQCFYYGINVFDSFKAYLKNTDTFKYNITSDIQFIIDYFKILKLILKDVNDIKLIDKLDVILNQLKKIQLLYIKLFIKRKDNIKENIILLIDDVKYMANDIIVIIRNVLFQLYINEK